ncbi:hypothetical protein ACIP79_00575 [Streptomyces sp. NPDC088747]|uniref:hypothetical protein n=1 Tax=Streptomyces sp. NPDC088747 TaxID=3365886 RepID=UPI003804FF3C
MADEKLVRDLIPAIAPGRDYRTADADEMPRLLNAKLLEEAQEVADARTAKEWAAELADVLEVVHALAARYGLTPEQLEGMRRDKAIARGGFALRVVLLEGEDSDG